MTKQANPCGLSKESEVFLFFPWRSVTDCGGNCVTLAKVDLLEQPLMDLPVTYSAANTLARGGSEWTFPSVPSQAIFWKLGPSAVAAEIGLSSEAIYQGREEEREERAARGVAPPETTEAAFLSMD